MATAREEFERLVPDPLSRRFFLRIFKWTVAFSTWTETLSVSLSALQRKLQTETETETADRDRDLDTQTFARSLSPSLSASINNNNRSLSPSRLLSDLSLSPSHLSSSNNNNNRPSTAQTLGRSTVFNPVRVRVDPPGGSAPPPPTTLFAHRSATSEVKAREALQRNRERIVRETRQTDALLNKTIEEYDRYVSLSLSLSFNLWLLSDEQLFSLSLSFSLSFSVSVMQIPEIGPEEVHFPRIERKREREIQTKIEVETEI